MDLIAALQVLLRVADTGSFSAVAKERGVTQPAVSRQITALEVHLKTRLVHRSTHAVSLTEEGKQVLELAQKMVDSADALKQFSKRRRDIPSGLVRIAVPVPAGIYIGSHLGRLLAEYPELSIDLVLRDTPSQLIEEGLDLELRTGPVEESSLIARRIGTTTAFVVASPAYLEKHKSPKHPQDLEHHQCIVLRREREDHIWWFGEKGSSDSETPNSISVSVRSRFGTNNSEAVRRAALDGIGVARLSHLQVSEDIASGRLHRLLPEYPCRRHPLYLVYASRRALPLRTRVVIEFVTTLANRDPYLSLQTKHAP